MDSCLPSKVVGWQVGQVHPRFGPLRALAMILGFLAIEALAHVLSVLLVQLHRRADDERDSFIGRAKEDIELDLGPRSQRCRVVAAEARNLLAAAIAPGIDEVGSLATTLRREITEGQYVRTDHEVDEFLFIDFHAPALLLASRAPQSAAAANAAASPRPVSADVTRRRPAPREAPTLAAKSRHSRPPRSTAGRRLLYSRSMSKPPTSEHYDLHQEMLRLRQVVTDVAEALERRAASNEAGVDREALLELSTWVRRKLFTVTGD